MDTSRPSSASPPEPDPSSRTLAAESYTGPNGNCLLALVASEALRLERVSFSLSDRGVRIRHIVVNTRAHWQGIEPVPAELFDGTGGVAAVEGVEVRAGDVITIAAESDEPGKTVAVRFDATVFEPSPAAEHGCVSTAPFVEALAALRPHVELLAHSVNVRAHAAELAELCRARDALAAARPSLLERFDRVLEARLRDVESLLLPESDQASAQA